MIRIHDPLALVASRISNVSQLAYAPTGALASSWTPGRTDDPTSQMDAMGSVGTLFSIVNRISTKVASIPWHMHREQRGSVCDICEAENVANVTMHPALSVWNKPNDAYTRGELVETVQQHLDLTGEGFLVVLKVAGRPVQLWPVRPDRMKPIKLPAPRFLDGWIYTDPDGTPVRLERDEVIQLRMPNPIDPYRGMGPVQTLLHQLYGLRFSAQYNSMFFRNSAQPGGVVEFPDGLTENQWKEFVIRWGEQHRGVSNAHRVATIERGKWIPTTYSMKDMMFPELRQVSRDEIREAFGVHKHILGIADDVNRAASEAARVDFGTDTIQPRLDRWGQGLVNDLLPMFGAPMARGYSFVHASPVPHNAEAEDAARLNRATVFETYIRAGVTPADAAMLAGIPAVTMRGVA